MQNSLFFGNGFNRAFKGSVSWDALLKKIKKGIYFENGNLPNTMIYERAYLERNNSKREGVVEEKTIKLEIADAMERQGPNALYELILSLRFSNYLTTNYDNAFKKAFHGNSQNMSTEEIYSIRRHTVFNGANHECSLWNIHGEIDHPKSIMLGLDHYCGSIGKIDAYIKGHYEYVVDKNKIKSKPIHHKIIENDFDSVSWIELFFNTNMHILGISLDYSETDLWWILNKRARIIQEVGIKNEIYFYVSKIDDEKKGLLVALDVNVVHIPCEGKSSARYADMHRKSIERVKFLQELSANI